MPALEHVTDRLVLPVELPCVLGREIADHFERMFFRHAQAQMENDWSSNSRRESRNRSTSTRPLYPLQGVSVFFIAKHRLTGVATQHNVVKGTRHVGRTRLRRDYH